MESVEPFALRPALFANYSDLTALRYDYPVVLALDGDGEASVRSLSSIMDGIVRELAQPGAEGERLTKHVLRLEREIRTAAAKGTAGKLTALWDAAAKRLTAKGDAHFAESLRNARSALTVDGEVLDCGKETPVRLLNHLWLSVQERKAKRFGAMVQRLTLKLGDMLKADHVRSDAGRSAASLKAAVGTTYHEAIDFEAMASVLAKAPLRTSLPAAQRARVEQALAALKGQRFFATGSGKGVTQPHGFVFETCEKAMQAYRERHPEMTAVAKAMAIADLETEGLYQESKHDLLFAGFGEDMLDAQDAALFPDYLVCLRADQMDAAESARLMEMLNAGLPVKILLQTDDVLGESQLVNKRNGGVATSRLARMAIEVDDTYVLQSSASHLYQLREPLLKGLSYTGPALFSVYSGASATMSGVPPYLAAAAAMESRAFPAFTYDPSAGSDLASRFDLKSNPQPDRAWPVETLTYEDADHQRVAQDLAFTFADFAACDTRCAKHFARVPRDKWNGSIVPMSDALSKGAADKVPCMWMVDADNKLHKVIADQKVQAEARRCAETWHSLQELGGIHNSHFERLLAIEKQAWEAQRPAAAPAAAAAAAPAAAAAAAAPAPAPAAAPEAEAEKASDDPYIETPRCTSCNECTNLNDRMFGYDANKQAFIKDVNAGTYRQLVEAAENCQVSIIHPGKPRNTSEPGLDELIKRAEAFQ